MDSMELATSEEPGSSEHLEFALGMADLVLEKLAAFD